MKCLSIRNPWAWAIIRPDINSPAFRDQAADYRVLKDVENRSWPTKVRGRVAVHVSASMTVEEYQHAARFIAKIIPPGDIPTLKNLRIMCGHIIGTVAVVDSVRTSNSPWYMGDHAHVLTRPLPCRPVPYKGRLGYFDIPDGLITCT